jgi:uncharacterized hydrophobic protein (TIGR00341 family)
VEQRLIEILLPEGRGDDIQELLHGLPLDGYWRDSVANQQARIRILLTRCHVEAVLDILEPYLENLPGAVAMLLVVETSIPRKKEEPAVPGEDVEVQKKRHGNGGRLSRHELYVDISSAVGISPTYLWMVILSAIVAAIGLIRNDMAIIIGAMVLAPLLVPNVALALASTLGDDILAGKAIRTAAAGLILAIAVAVGVGLFYNPDQLSPAILARTNLRWGDLLLAFASGVAGVLAFTSGGQLSLIGVMVAVALMPPLVSAGILLGCGKFADGLHALELTLANVICVNLAGIITFSLQGIRPVTFWEKSKAGKARRKALMLWIVFLLLLAAILLRRNL